MSSVINVQVMISAYSAGYGYRCHIMYVVDVSLQFRCKLSVDPSSLQC